MIYLCRIVLSECCLSLHSHTKTVKAGLDTNGCPIARGNGISCRASEIYLAVALSGNRHTLPHHLVNAGKSDKLTNIHYNDKLDEIPDLFTTSFASGGDP